MFTHMAALPSLGCTSKWHYAAPLSAHPTTNITCKGDLAPTLATCLCNAWLPCVPRTLPHREYSTLAATAGGKQLVLHGGHSRLHESVGRETAVLNLDSLTWEVPETATQPTALLGASSSVVGRNKLLVFGGSQGEQATAAVQQLATDSMKWSSISSASVSQPQPRLCHAAVALSDQVYVFGGMTSDGTLLDDMWSLELDTMQWTQLHTFGATPSARKGA